MTVLAYPAMTNAPPQRPEADLFLAEANHRIANQLALLASLLQLEASAVARGPELLPQQQVKALLDKLRLNVVAMGDVHRRLAGNSDQSVKLADHLITNTSALISALALSPLPGLRHHLNADCFVTGEQAQLLSLIVGEVVLNAIKHAHPTGIAVQIELGCNRTMDGRILVEVSDDGVGLPEGFNTHTQGGLGFKLIRLLADKLNADLRIESDSLGVSFILLFPKPH